MGEAFLSRPVAAPVEEERKAAQACVTDAHTRHPHSRLWGNGTTASSDGQFFRASDRAAKRGDVNLHYGSERGTKFYSGLSDQYGYFRILPISPTESEAVYVLDGLLDHDTILEIEELFTDTGDASDHVFALFALIGKRFAPRLRNIKDRNFQTFEKPIPIRRWPSTSARPSTPPSSWSIGTTCCVWPLRSQHARSRRQQSSKSFPRHRNRANWRRLCENSAASSGPCS